MDLVALVAVITGGSLLLWGLFAWSWRRHYVRRESTGDTRPGPTPDRPTADPR